MSDNLIILADRVKEISFTTGTADFVLDGPANGFSSFDTRYSNGDVLFYAATNGVDYEVGSGIFTVGVTDSIVRMPFKTSATNDAKVSFTNGAKEVYVTYPATHSVYIGSGVADLNFPQSSGLAFWSSSNILNYDSDIIWDINNKRLGIKKALPSHAIDVGGYNTESSVQASGFYVGENGVVFPAANNGDVNYTGGSQVVHFEPNELDATSLVDQVFDLSGNVDNIFVFKQQAQGTFLAGPGTDVCSGPCPDDYPVFRTIDVSDIPDLSSLYVNFADLEAASGVLRADLETASGILRTDFLAGDTIQHDNLVAASGELRSAINDNLKVFNVTETGQTYEFSGFGTSSDINPSLSLRKGNKYTFNVSAANYPFFIMNAPSTDIADIFSDGVTNNGEDDGAVTFVVPQDAPDILYYSSTASQTMSGVIYLTDVNITAFNNYDSITDVDTESDDTVVLWDKSASSYKNIPLDSLMFAPSGNSYLKYETIGAENSAGQTGEVTFDNTYAYFKTDNGWRRVKIETFETTTPAPTTTTTIDPSCTTPAPCDSNLVRVVTGFVDGCPTYDCVTTTTPAPTTPPPTTTPEPVYNHVLTWGNNGNNQLGYETDELFSSVPTEINAANITLLSASDYHVLAISSSRKLYAWGWNSYGQIGNSSTIDVKKPILVGQDKEWISAAAGDYHSAAISSDGKLYTWGANNHGQLGKGNRTGSVSPSQLGTNTNWSKVFCGTAHTIAINTLGEMYAWGSNEYGQVGNGSFEDVLSPVKIGVGRFWKTADAYMHSLAISEEGELFAWGRNTEGQLGTARYISVTEGQSTTSSLVLHNEDVNTPTLISKTTSTSITSDSVIPNAGSGDNWIAIAAGYKHSLAINQAGELHSCGTNTEGAAGLPSNVGFLPAFFKISDERNWLNVAAGNYHSLAINSYDNLFTTGRNNNGQQGNDTDQSYFGFVLLSTDYDWEQPVAGYDFSAAIGNDPILETPTTTTGAPLVFTNTLTIGSDGTASDPTNGISVTGGQEGDVLEYNIPDNKGDLPLSCLVYAANTFLVALTVTNGYATQTCRLTRGGQQYIFDIASGRVDI